MSEKIFDKVKPGVATGNDVSEIFRIAKANNFAAAGSVKNNEVGKWVISRGPYLVFTLIKRIF